MPVATPNAAGWSRTSGAMPATRFPHPTVSAARVVGWNDAGRRPNTLDVPKPRTVHATRRWRRADGSGSEVSLGQLLEHVDVERLVRDQLLESCVLAFEFLQPLRVV